MSHYMTEFIPDTSLFIVSEHRGWPSLGAGDIMLFDTTCCRCGQRLATRLKASDLPVATLTWWQHHAACHLGEPIAPALNI